MFHAFPPISLGCCRFWYNSVSRKRFAVGARLSAGVAQLVEQLTCNQQVDGSTPPASSRGAIKEEDLFFRAQIVIYSEWAKAWSRLGSTRAGSEVVKRIRL